MKVETTKRCNYYITLTAAEQKKIDQLSTIYGMPLDQILSMHLYFAFYMAHSRILLPIESQD